VLWSSQAVRRGPLTLLVALALVASVAAVAVANPSSSEVRGDLAAAEERYEEIDQQRGQAQNAYNDALGELEFAEVTLAALQRDLTELRAEAAALTVAVEDHVRLLHKLGPGVELSTIVSSDPSDLGLRSTTMRQILERRSSDLELLTATNTAIAAAELRQAETVSLAEQHTAELEARNAELESLFAATADEVAELEELLQITVQREEEEAAARQRELQRQRELARQQATGSPSLAAASSGPAPSTRSSVGSAVSVALGQVGKPYSWGASGPGAFDCSGLVTYAYRAVGISHLPRSSSAMYGATTRISRADLRPGDLVFYHSPVSHVAIYIGGGQVVEAPNSGSQVRVRADGLTRRGVVGFGRV
jgi:peptidoglycan DL-endopeptidase CwlO